MEEISVVQETTITEAATGYQGCYGTDDSTSNDSDIEDTSDAGVDKSVIEKSPASGVLMPPPTIIPDTPPQKTIKKLLSSKQTNTTKSVGHFNDDIFGSLLKDCPTNSKKVHCSRPVKDISCSTNSSLPVDLVTKKKFISDLNAKIYGSDICDTTPMTNEKLENGRMFPVIRENGWQFQKRDEEHFSKKNLVIDNFDVNNMGLPMRCSTPTPSISGYTVMAGYCDDELDKNEDSIKVQNIKRNGYESESEASETGDEFLNEVLSPYVKTGQRKKKFQTPSTTKVVTTQGKETCTTKQEVERNMRNAQMNMQHGNGVNNTFCNNWVSENNAINDPPPSVATFLTQHDNVNESLLDITSATQLNIGPTDNLPVGNKSVGSGISVALMKQAPNIMFA